MSRIDWSVLGLTKKGLAVEGIDDKTVIEAFLEAGEGRHWSDWRNQVMVEVAGSSPKVFQELESGDARIWGLIDRDWRTDGELEALRADYPQLLVLPRVTIENYCIAPDELATMLPASRLRSLPNLQSDIDAFKNDWIQNGALWQVLHENGAHEFCRGHQDGYPMALLYEPVTVEADIEAQFQKWHLQLNPAEIMPAYRRMLADFRANPTNNYTRHIHGKYFFSRVVTQQILNSALGQRKSNDWFNDLFTKVTDCPGDMVPVLQQVVS
jgi:hypothetical protein